MMIEDERPGYKHTPLGWIPEEWEVKEFGAFAEIIMGQSPVGNTYNSIGNGSPLINGPTEFTERYPVKIQWTTSPTKMCKEGDILLCVRGSTGRLNIANEEYCIGRGVAAIRAKETSSRSFLEFQITNIVNKICSLTTGSTFPNIDSKSLKSIKVSCPPPLPEQRKIAAILSAWDDAIAKTRKLTSRLELQKKGLMQELLRPKEGWEVKRLTHLLKKVSRPIEWNERELYDLISVRRNSGGAFYRGSRYGYQILTKQLFTVKESDFLISKMQIVHGASAIVTPDLTDMKVSGSYIVVCSKDENKLDIHFFDWISKTPRFYRLTFLSSYGVHIEKMTFDFHDFLKRKIIIPISIEAQRKEK